MNRYTILLCTGVVVLATGCNRPKVIHPTEPTAGEETVVFSDDDHAPMTDASGHAIETEVHSVMVLEVLPTARYVYLRVKEHSEEFWIATIKREVEVGKTYFYYGGLLKTNFESKEHNRSFPRMYLVSSLVDEEHGHRGTSPGTGTKDSPTDVGRAVMGPVTIAELAANPTTYEGKVIQITGKCVKVNHNIMGLNWIHLKDGSKDDFDLVITSTSSVHEGHTVTMTGRVVLEKDFGAGYKYAVILEEGKFVQ